MKNVGLNNPDYLKDKLGAFNPDSLDGSGDKVKHFLEAGKIGEKGDKKDNMLDLFLRVCVKDEVERNTYILALARYEEFGQDQHKEMLLRRLTLSVSIGGRGRTEALMAATNLISTSAIDIMLGGNGKDKAKNIMYRREGPNGEGGTISTYNEGQS